MDGGHSTLNPSSILDLKAELHKKYDSFNKAKLAQNSEFLKPTRFKSKNESCAKDKKQITVVKPKEDDEEDLALKKSRLALEAKSKLYEKITSSSSLIDDEENEQYLVDFQRKVLYNPPEMEKYEKNDAIFNDNNTEETLLTSSGSDPVLDQSKTMQTTPKNANFGKDTDADQPIHYQNVQYNEIRDHGTAYFAFSTDEAKRNEQMEELNTLRQNTEEQRLMKERMLKKRKAMLQSRLAKVCERRNIDKNVVETYTSLPDSNDSVDNVPSANAVDLDSIPLPDVPEKKEEPKKEPKIRPWDIGKPDLNLPDSRKRKIMTQNDWVEEKRNERPTEFAPPSFYS